MESIANKNAKEFAMLFEEVSGSGDLREEYDDAKLAKASAEENVMFVFKKKKGLSAEKKQYKEQKEEAEKFNRLQEQLAQTQTDEAVFRLFHVEKDIAKQEKDLTKEVVAMEAAKQRNDELETMIEGNRKELAELHKDQTVKRRRLQGMKAVNQRRQPEEVRIRTELQRTERKLEADRAALEEKRQEKKKHEDELLSLEQSRRDLLDAAEAVEREMVEAEEQTVSRTSVEEYRRLKEQAATQTSSLAREVVAGERAWTLARQRESAVEGRLEELRSRREQTAVEVEMLEDRRRQVERKREEEEGLVAGIKAELDDVVAAAVERERQRDELERIVADATNELKEAKADRTEDVREKKFHDALASMKRMFPGVRGVLSDLCRPTQKRYREAVAVVFGKLMDAIVVDTSQTGEECINYLKEQRAGKATFLPLMDLRPAPIDPGLRRVGGTSKLVVDVLSFEDEFTLAVNYAAGDTLLCDTLDEARRIRFGAENRNVKVCSLDGTLINRAGFITGGTSERDERRVRKWDRSVIEQLKMKRANALRQIQALPTSSQEREKQADLAEKLATAQRRLEFYRLDVQNFDEKLRRAKEILSNTDAQILRLAAEAEAARSDVQRKKETVEMLRARLESMEESIFGDFAARVGATSVKQFEEMFLQALQALGERKLSLEQQLAKITAHIEYVRSHDLETPIRVLEDSIASLEARISSLQTAAERVQQNKSRNEEQIRQLEESIASVSAAYEELETKQAVRKSELTAATEVYSAHRKAVAAAETQVESDRTRKKELLKHYRMEQVRIPLKRKSDDGQEEDVDVSPVRKTKEFACSGQLSCCP